MWSLWVGISLDLDCDVVVGCTCSYNKNARGVLFEKYKRGHLKRDSVDLECANRSVVFFTY